MEKKIAWAMIISLLLPWTMVVAQQTSGSQPRYAVTLIPPNPKLSRKPGEKETQVRQDCEIAYTAVMHNLKKRCRFFDQERHKKRVEEFYRSNPDLDPTSLQNRLKVEEGVATLLVMVECGVESVKDDEFPLYYHTVDMALRVVDKRGSSEVYAMTKGKTRKILKAPQNIDDPHNADVWKDNRISRDFAIEWAAKEFVPQLLAEMEKRQESIQAFDFIAVRLSREQKVALIALLEKLARDGVAGIKVNDIKDTTDNGISAKANCDKGISGFMQILTERFEDSDELEDFVCDTDGFSVKAQVGEE